MESLSVGTQKVCNIQYSSRVHIKNNSVIFLFLLLLAIPGKSLKADNSVAPVIGGLVFVAGIVYKFNNSKSENPAEKAKKLFFKAAIHNDLEQMKVALQDETIQKNINQLDEYNKTALYYAAQSGNLHIVEVLLAAKADANVKADNGTTPVITASARGHMAVVRALVAAGADIHVRDDSGENAVVAAVHWPSRWATARYLLDEAGAHLEDLEKKRTHSESINRFYCEYVADKYVDKKNGKLSIELKNEKR